MIVNTTGGGLAKSGIRGALRANRVARMTGLIVSPCEQVRFLFEFRWSLTSRHMATGCMGKRGTDERKGTRGLRRMCMCV